MRKRRTTKDLRRANRSAVLRCLFQDGPATRVALAAKTGMSPATVGNVVSGLLEEGVVRETGQVESEGGRPAVIVAINPDHAAIVGVDVGETGAAIELFNLALDKLAATERPLRLGVDPAETLVTVVADGLSQLLTEAGITADQLLGIGVGVPGVVVRDGHDYIHAPSLGWDQVPLQALLQAALPAPVLVENGAKTMGRAEAWFGAGRGARDVIVALIGTGVGAAVIVDGEVQQGTTHSAGEWGHTTAVLDGRQCRCGARGCLETYIGAEGILATYHPDTDPVRLSDRHERHALAELRTKAERGDPHALETLHTTARYLGVAIADLMNLLNPDRIVLGGSVWLELGDQLFPTVMHEAAQHALQPPLAGATVEHGRFGPDAVALGAATLVLEPFIRSGAAPAADTPGRLPNALTRQRIPEVSTHAAPTDDRRPQ